MTVSHKITWQLGVRFPKTFPFVFVIGFPKSGTTWACQLVAAYLQLPYPRVPLFPLGFASAVHGHELVSKKYPYCVYVIRDGRDAMVSLFFHIQKMILQGNSLGFRRNQQEIFLTGDDPAQVRKNFSRFLEIQIKRPIGSRYSWAEHVMSSQEIEHPKLARLKYEELITDGAAALAREMSLLDGDAPNIERAQFFINDFSFSRSAAKSKKTEDKGMFLRKGVSGDWKNYFTREAADIFDHHCGTALIATGYEQDRQWLDALPAE